MNNLHVFIVLAVLLAACAPAPTPTPAASQTPAAGQNPADPPTPTSTEPAEDGRINPRVEDFQASVPAQLIPRDGIRPIYEPQFRPAAQAQLVDQELVIGTALDGEAKAYPISVLRFREMVNDEMAGIPTLVTW